MSQDYHKQSQNPFGMIIIVALILAIGVGGLWYWKKTPKTPAPILEADVRPVEPGVTETPSIIEAEPSQQPVSDIIDYGKLDQDEDLKALMEKRKKEYGINKSLDMIVTSDETLTIGDTSIPMQEIMDRIRLNEGGMLISDLGERAKREITDEERKELVEELDKAETRYKELEHTLSSTENTQDAQNTQDKYIQEVREYIELKEALADYRKYKDTVKEMEKLSTLPLKDKEQFTQETLDEINELTIEKSRLEIRLKTRLMPETTEEKLAQADASKNLPSEPSDEIKRQSLPHADDAQLDEKMKEIETYRVVLEEQLRHPETIPDKATMSRYIREHTRLNEILYDYQRYKEIQEAIEENRDMLDAGEQEFQTKIQNKTETLSLRRKHLEEKLIRKIMPEKFVDIYGIYVVRSGDNIWNIHFQFLKEYFANRNILLSSSDDEPYESGLSSGIGRILKFSEKMVYIFNMKDKKLDWDLNLIHPQSKIVVFNMARALLLLEEIDMANIRKIRFDGERLWLPAES